MRIRVATELDETAALDVVRADGELTGRQPSKATLAALRTVLRSPTTLTLVADDAGVVGLAVTELRGRELHLSVLCVTPEQRGRGVAQALVRALLERYPDVVPQDPGTHGLLERVRSRGRLDPG